MKKLADLRKLAARCGALFKPDARSHAAQPPRAHGSRLTRRWVRDPESGELICAWSLNEEGEEDAREPGFRLAA